MDVDTFQGVTLYDPDKKEEFMKELKTIINEENQTRESALTQQRLEIP